MSDKSTKRVSHHLVGAREEGIIDWDWIVDKTRHLEKDPSWRDPKLIHEQCEVLVPQRSVENIEPYGVEVWSEKGTVRGTIAPVLDEYGVGFRVQHGYGGATGIHKSAEISAGEELNILYVGDWDPRVWNVGARHTQAHDQVWRKIYYPSDRVIVWWCCECPI